jgi:hypothetical protein
LPDGVTRAWAGRVGRTIRRSAAVAIALLGLACSPVDLDGGADAGTTLPPVRLRGVALEGWSGAVRELSVEAREATIDLEARVARLEQVRIGLSGSEAGPLEVQAPSGEFDLARDSLWLHGGVEGWTQPGERFATAEVRFDQEGGRLHSDQAVSLSRPNLQLTAEGMDLDLRSRRLRLSGAVRAELKPE